MATNKHSMKVTILGGGATGLVAGFLLARHGHEVTILEAAKDPGGLLATFDVGAGVQLEHYYHHFFTHDAEINWLLGELGLDDQVRFMPTTMGIYRNARIHPFNGLRDILGFTAIPWLDRLRFAASSALLAYSPAFTEAEDRAAIEWFEGWAGKAATDAIWRPMLEIKFGSSAARVPLAWMAGRLRQRARSRSGAQERLGYLEGSLNRLVEALVASFVGLGGKLETGVRTERLILDGQGKIAHVRTSNGTRSVDRVLATVPTPILASWLRQDAPSYAQELERIEYLAATCTVLSLDRSLSPVYWLNVADPGFDFGGVIEQTNLVPPACYNGQHLVYLSRYHDWNHPMMEMDEGQLVARQIEQLSRLFATDVAKHLQRSWVFRARFAAPKVAIGFHRLIPDFRSPISNLFVASMPHVYPDERSVNNSIRVASQVVSEMGQATAEVPCCLSLAAKYGRAA